MLICKIILKTLLSNMFDIFICFKEKTHPI